MRNCRKRILSLLLCGACCLTALAGCGGSAGKESAQSGDSGKVSASGEFDARAITEGVELTIAAPENMRVDYATNKMTKAIEEELGVKLSFVTYPSADYDSKLNIIVQSGATLPDIILKPSASMYTDWADQGAIIALNEYYDDPNMSANIQDACERTGLDLPHYLMQANGDIYALPRLGQSIGGEVWEKLWVYQPWLDAIGADVPETTEEFRDVLRKIVASDPNGNGKADEIGLTGDVFGNWDEAWFNCLMSAFVYAHDSERRIVEDGKVGFAYTTEEWREGLRYIKSLFDEGLIPLETLTQDRSQYGAIAKQTDPMQLFSFGYWHYLGTDAQVGADYSYIPALKGPDGTQYAMYKPALPEAGAVISADCKNPEAAFLVCDFMCSEEMSITQRWGERGVNWDYWEDAKGIDKSNYTAAYPGYEISIIAYDDTAFWNGNDLQDASYLQTGCYVWDADILCGIATATTGATEEEQASIDFVAKQNEAILACQDSKYRPEEIIDYLPLSADENAQIADAKATLTSYVNEMTCAFLTGSKDLDKDWDSYLTELEKIGIQSVVDVYQVAYDRVH